MKPDYEKKYKDALKLARSYYSEDTNTFLDTLFPELRENERIREELIVFFQDDLRGDYWHDLEVGHILAWLKSLRPQWRPSEEQMEALKHYVDTTTDGEIDLLYNDLKKLI